MKYLIVITQILTTWIFRLMSLFIVKKKTVNMTMDDWSGKLLIVVNHTSVMDPFLVTSAIPYLRFVRLAPFRFFVANRFFRYYLLPFLLSHGCFPAKKQRGYKSGLEHAISLIEDSQTLTIFPEGKISRFDRQNAPKRGVTVLASLPDVRVVPVRVKLNRRRSIFRSYSLIVGKPFNAKNMTAEQIMDVVYGLKFR